MSYTVKYDNTSTIEDFSLQLKDFTTNTVPLALADIEYLYVGYYKQFKQFFVELSVPNTVAGVMAFEYYDGSSWQALTVTDESENFFKSGFVYFDMPSDWEATTVDSKENFYIRFQPSVSHDLLTTIDGIGILLSNDRDLIAIKENIISKHALNGTWVGKHELARKHIIQRLRNLGHRTFTSKTDTSAITGTSSIVWNNLTEFDLLEPFELREASKYFAISMIYLNELTDEEDDKWERQGKRYEAMAEEAVSLFMLKVDTNDNGVEDEGESDGNTGINLSWV